ncbi:SpoIIE family protein phosphatase [Anaerorhabdus furcosa]|uniref:Stage II sporulation protein E (SpoIIE) n=1 Tax=Anaerorhabdus furcosa TaxID=118967 RepID=A0A1T4LMZ3_9FIRM|nr:SpoIIE family protein phosphatase [Anaerorhabdus furcosa]SJZ56063.1 Stage II sporulation protein E (SpoIIE) [Anaerorhabdus furcosa]
MSNKVHVESFFKSLNKKNEELCGDKVEVRRNQDSFIMVLADGLGSGVKANILSTLTSTIISEMIASGATIQDAVETMAQTLPECQERGIAYSTFTILQVFYDGQAHLVEFDNPATIFIRNNQLVEMNREVRIIGKRKITDSTFTVEKDDVFVMFSDGIIHAGIGQTLNFGWDLPEVQEFLLTYTKNEDSAKQIAQILLANVNNLYGGKPGDDSTVACAKILEAKEARVMVGPPLNEEDDEKVVMKLLSASGKKVCCGGTTSNIVSRITGKEIKMDELVSLVSDVPPMAYIDGIDLVTEGVLTLQKVNKYLSRCVESSEYLEELIQSKGKDGALCMVKLYLQECSQITFMVGRSDNPAHKAIAYSTISLNAKIQLIREMAENLKKLGKIVSIELY